MRRRTILACLPIGAIAAAQQLPPTARPEPPEPEDDSRLPNGKSSGMRS